MRGPAPSAWPCSGPGLPVLHELSPLSHSALVLVLGSRLECPKLRTLLTLSKAVPPPWLLLQSNPHSRGTRDGAEGGMTPRDVGLTVAFSNDGSWNCDSRGVGQTASCPLHAPCIQGAKLRPGMGAGTRAPLGCPSTSLHTAGRQGMEGGLHPRSDDHSGRGAGCQGLSSGDRRVLVWVQLCLQSAIRSRHLPPLPGTRKRVSWLKTLLLVADVPRDAPPHL